MDFLLDDDQRSLQELAALVLSENCNDESLRRFAHGGEPYDRELLVLLAETGLLGLGITEEHGGTGFGMIEIGLLLEEQGRTLAPVPLYASLVLGAQSIRLAGSAKQQARWLPEIAAGRVIATGALEEAGNSDPLLPMLRARRDRDAWVLSGVKIAVPYGVQAGIAVVTATTEDRTPVAFLVEPDAPGLTITPQVTTGSEPHAQFDFVDVRLGDEDMLKSPDNETVSMILQNAQMGLVAMQLGVAQSALIRTAEYTSGRIQFGRPIGSMQAVQQRAADGFIDLEAMRSSYLRAIWALNEGIVDDAEISAAKYWAAIGGHRITHSAQHMHGGVGSDVEYPIHRYFLRARQIESALGGSSLMVAKIGQAIAAGQSKPLAGV